jgi:hypothetical protein
VGDAGVMGDGHNNTATAAELLGVRTNNGKPVPYLGGKAHDTRTRTVEANLRKVVAQMDQLEKESGLKLSSLTEYQEAQKEILDCALALSDPTGYLSKKGFQVDSSGDFKAA